MPYIGCQKSEVIYNILDYICHMVDATYQSVVMICKICDGKFWMSDIIYQLSDKMPDIECQRSCIIYLIWLPDTI